MRIEGRIWRAAARRLGRHGTPARFKHIPAGYALLNTCNWTRVCCARYSDREARLQIRDGLDPSPNASQGRKHVSSHAHAESSAHAPRSLEAMLKAIGVPLAVAIAATIWFSPTPESLSLQGHKALALFGGIFVLYLTE